MLYKETALLRLLGLRIPMILFVGPQVLALDDARCRIRIPYGWRTANRLIGAMYFGALCVGADLAGGMPAGKLMLTRHRGLRLVFGEMDVEFLKRADGDVVFENRDVPRVVDAVERAAASGERVTVPVEVVATVPDRYGDEPVARFRMTLSVKVASKKPSAATAPSTSTRDAGGIA